MELEKQINDLCNELRDCEEWTNSVVSRFNDIKDENTKLKKRIKELESEKPKLLKRFLKFLYNDDVEENDKYLINDFLNQTNKQDMDYKKITYTTGIICYTLIVSFRIEALIETQNKDTFSALIGWLMLLVYFIAYNNRKLNN